MALGEGVVRPPDRLHDLVPRDDAADALEQIFEHRPLAHREFERRVVDEGAAGGEVHAQGAHDQRVATARLAATGEHARRSRLARQKGLTR